MSLLLPCLSICITSKNTPLYTLWRIITPAICLRKRANLFKALNPYIEKYDWFKSIINRVPLTGPADMYSSTINIQFHNTAKAQACTADVYCSGRSSGGWMTRDRWTVMSQWCTSHIFPNNSLVPLSSGFHIIFFCTLLHSFCRCITVWH